MDESLVKASFIVTKALYYHTKISKMLYFVTEKHQRQTCSAPVTGLGFTECNGIWDEASGSTSFDDLYKKSMRQELLCDYVIQSRV